MAKAPSGLSMLWPTWVCDPTPSQDLELAASDWITQLLLAVSLASQSIPMVLAVRLYLIDKGSGDLLEETILKKKIIRVEITCLLGSGGTHF